MSTRVASQRELMRLVAIAEATHGYPMAVSVSAWKPSRSNEQNAYLFGVAYPLLADAKGYTVDEIHEWMCGTFFGWVDKPCPKTPRNPEGIASCPRRTTTRDENGKRDVISKAQFSDFIAMVQRIGAHAGVFIPDPEQGRVPAA